MKSKFKFFHGIKTKYFISASNFLLDQININYLTLQQELLSELHNDLQQERQERRLQEQRRIQEEMARAFFLDNLNSIDNV